ncbi:hypothetical protein DB346_08385 [Verrucomicrobia bacterium LW23]|nr:hypothetical protein DB346_08385 [Verrucomicrobia bacterium LW23]
MPTFTKLPCISVAEVQAIYTAEGLASPYLPAGTDTHIHVLASREAEAPVPARAADCANANADADAAAGADAGPSEDARIPTGFITFPDIEDGGLPRAFPHDLYALGAWKNALLYSAGLSLPAVAFGFAGHGFVSQAVHYYLATPKLVVLLQYQWGCINADPARQAALYRANMGLVARLHATATALAGKDAFPADHRMVVVESEFQPSVFGWVPTHAGKDFDEATALVRASHDPLLSALSGLSKLG